LTDAELRAFLRDPDGATRHPKLSHVIMVLLLTGQRRGELASARWGDIDLDAGLWRIPPEQAKNGREQLVPLSAPAIEHLRGLRKLCGASAWVLPATAGERPIDPMRLSRALARCHQGPDRQTPGRFARVGIAAFTLHDLRRTCRTGLARLKVEPHIAERVLGHAQERLAATYDTHAYLDEKRAALELWAGYLQGLCGAGEGAPPPAL
jgi:integrase